MKTVASAPIPEVRGDWEAITLGEVCHVENGCPFESKYFNERAGLPLVRVRDVNAGASETFYSGPYEDKYLVANGDLLVGMDGEFHVRKWTAGTALLNQRVCRLVPNIKRVDKDFLGYAIRAPLSHIEAHTPYTTVKHISARQILAIRLPFPPLDEQRQIAAVLSAVQRAIELQEFLIRLTAELKKALMNKLFTEGARGEPQKQTEIGPVPESWALKRCDELCPTISVGVVVKPRSYYVDVGVPAFRSFNVREDRLIADDLVYFSHADNDGALCKSKLRAGDVLIVRTGYPGTSCVVPQEFDGANCIDIIFARPGPDVESAYLSRFLNSDAGKTQVTASSHGLAQQHLNVGAVKRVLVPLPALDEQREIVEALAAIDRKVDTHTRLAKLLTNLFRTLLSQLMTAQIRVHDLDLSALEEAGQELVGAV